MIAEEEKLAYRDVKPPSFQESRPFHRKVVSIGGGTGQYHFLKGLFLYNEPSDITAIAGTWDDGGDSGERRVNNGILPPGDARQCIVALAKPGRQERSVDALFNYRKNGHTSMGNEIINYFIDIDHGDQAGIDAVRDLLLMDPQVLYVTNQDLVLYAKTKSQRIFEGESQIDTRHKIAGFDPEDNIESIYFNVNPPAADRAIRAILEADLVVFPAGSLYGSLLPHCLFDDIVDAIKESRAKLVITTNLTSEPGQTDQHSKASHHIAPFVDYLDDPAMIDYVIFNKNGLDPRVIHRYADQGQLLIKMDEAKLQRLVPNAMIIQEDVASYDRRKNLLRHDHRLAHTILELP